VIRVSARPLKILVAEDTPFNQKFIMRLLERWNHRATLVENGRQALEAWQKESFDLVLMDVQMPEMDGLATTQKIRKREAKIWNEERELEAQRSTLNENASEALSAFSIQNPESSIQNRVPIIAMTAHAIKGDRERCLEAGMDEYISKPIDSDRLFEAIEKLTKKTTDTQNAADRLATIDNELLLKAFDGDWSFLKEVVEVFLSDYPRLVDDLLRASEARDSDLLMRSAHSLKGMLNNFQADSAAEVAFELERKGKLEDFDGVQANIKTLQNRLTEVDKRLRNIVEQKSD
jgi:CheY-like chemotaxis protein